MGKPSDDIFPIFDQALQRSDREALLKQRGHVFWFYGLSGSGKSTLALRLERRLHSEGYLTQLLDGDNIRTGLNHDLGFSDEDRRENIRRIAEVAKLFVGAGFVTLASFITPTMDLRNSARAIVVTDDFAEIYIECSYETCARRDVKGLYAKASTGDVQQFTGKDSRFEPGENPDLTINTEKLDVDTALDELYQFVLPKIRRSSPT